MKKEKEIYLLISKCKECPYCDKKFDTFEEGNCKLMRMEKIEDIHTIPEWCPLSDRGK